MKSQEELRREIKEALLTQRPEERAKRNRAIAEKAVSLPAFRKAKSVHVYLSLPTEADTWALIECALKEGKRVAAPRADVPARTLRWFEIHDPKKDCARKGAFGICEPDGRLKEFEGPAECVFVPGLVFDRKNNRIGRGMGFYDRFLAGAGSGAFKAGLAFSFQVLEEVPVQAHDAPLDTVITD